MQQIKSSSNFSSQIFLLKMTSYQQSDAFYWIKKREIEKTEKQITFCKSCENWLVSLTLSKRPVSGKGQIP